MSNLFELKNLLIEPVETSLYIPPIVWKGDSLGHLGINDLFFFVLEGECFLNVDNESYIIKPGQMAFLPKGKMRTYTHSSENFKMYEMAFVATTENKNLMNVLELDCGDFVIDVPDVKKVCELFETSHIVERYKSPLHNVTWCANILSVISIYANVREKEKTSEGKLFRPVINFMSENLNKPAKTEDFANILHMQTTYFIKRFKKQFGIPPISYFNRMKIYKAMTLLAGTDLPIDKIAQMVGISDSSYFARMFRSFAKVTPTKYRTEFKRNI